MPFALWVAAVSVVAALVAVLAAVWPKGLRVVAAVALAGAAAWPVLAAETPLGIGDGVVPDVRGRDDCEALRALEERGLRWRFGAAGPVHERVPAELQCSGDVAQEDEDHSNPIAEQEPSPGTKVGEGGVVRLRRRCEPPCAIA